MPLARPADTPASDATGAAPLTLRARPASPDELRSVPWLGRLDAAERARVVADLRVVHVKPGELVCRVGRPVTYWFGLVDGLLKMSNDGATGLPIETFHRLLDSSIPFNRFVMQQLNERLGQFIAAREIDRLTHPDERVARNLAALFHPVLYPGVGSLLRITQEELGYLVGLSRQRVNEALRELQRAGVIRIEYGGVRVLNLADLRGYRSA